MVVVMPAVMMVVSDGAAGTQIAGLDPAPAVPDRAADVRTSWTRPLLGGGAKLAGARQRHRFGAAGDKRRCGHDRQSDGGGNKQTTHSEFLLPTMMPR